MKKFFIALFKAIGYFAIYLGVQSTVSFVYSFFAVIPLVGKYAFGSLDLSNPAVFEQYMNDVLQMTLDSTMPVTIISGILTVFVVGLMIMVDKKKIKEELSLRKLDWGTIPPIVLLGLSLNVLTGLFLAALPESWLGSYEETSSIVFNSGIWMMTIATAIVAPIVEEIIFRGLAYKKMKKGMPTVAAMILASALFAVAHGHPVWMLYTFVFGLILIWVFERTKSLYASILLHFGYNFCAVLQSMMPADAPEMLGVGIIVGAALVAVGCVIWLFMIPKVTLPEEAVTKAQAEDVTVVTDNANETETGDGTDRF